MGLGGFMRGGSNYKHAAPLEFLGPDFLEKTVKLRGACISQTWDPGAGFLVTMRLRKGLETMSNSFLWSLGRRWPLAASLGCWAEAQDQELNGASFLDSVIAPCINMPCFVVSPGWCPW
jgi:hypothetical protein